MSTVSIYKNYNNYFNRIYKASAPKAGSLLYFDEINFNPNDGVTTSLVVGKPEKQYNGIGDYLYIDKDLPTETHWFILEAVRLRGNQYNLTLRRDLLRDFYYNWINSDCKIKRGLVTNDNPLIFNEEPIAVNQIKQGEFLLKDNSKMAWICGFVNRNMETDTDVNIKSEVIPDLTVENLQNWEYYGKEYKRIWSVFGRFYRPPLNLYLSSFRYSTSAGYYKSADYMSSYELNTGDGKPKADLMLEDGVDYELIENQNYIRKGAENSVFGNAAWASNWRNFLSIDNIYPDNSDIESFDGKIIQDHATGKYYRIIYKTGTYPETKKIKDITQATNFYNSFNDFVKGAPYIVRNGDIGLETSYTVQYKKLEFEEVVFGTYKLTFPSVGNRYINKQAPFDLFCIPYSNDMTIKIPTVKESGEVVFETFSTNENFALSIASELGRVLGSNIYDIQLLPYCPITGYVIEGTEENIFNINNSQIKRTTKIYNEENVLSYCLFWSTASNGSFNIFKSIEIGYDQEDLKIKNMTEFIRLVSPNYNGQYEFNAAKNNGVEFFNVDFTYLPYSSYIHVNPNFGGIYGKDYNDARGLIAQGDFSIMYTSDAWIQYQINNKNYDNIFNRQIQSMDTQRKYERIQQAANIMSSAISTGVNTGLLTGGVFTGVGAGLMSAGAGAADLYMSDKLYEERKDYSRDIFEYNLENVRALPYSIAKTTAINKNNKIFPFIEYWGTTQEEKELAKNFIIEYSMTLNKIDKPINFISNKWGLARRFLQAEIIKIEGLEEDNHVAISISNELSKGIYLELLEEDL